MKILFFFIISLSVFGSGKILNDYKGRINSKFKIDPFFKEQVEFWYQIYTKYPAKETVLHDKTKYGLIYSSSQSPNADKKKLIKKLKTLASNLNSHKKLLREIKKHYKIPRRNRKTFFNKLIKNIRMQVGQKDQIKNGLIRYAQYEYYLKKLIKKFRLPVELLAIPFLESSFNPKAKSKASAAGAWQFMPLIASYFLPRRTRYVDYRYNTVLSSIAALHLLKQNIQILKRYDLAVTAYNSGTKNLVKARRKYKKKTTLEFIIKHHKGKNFGFASKNFYSEFLALTRVLAYKHEIHTDLPKSKKIDYDIYLTKCKLKPHYLFKNVKSADLRKENYQFLSPRRHYKKHQLVISEIQLSKRKYQKVSSRYLTRLYPKNFYKKYRTKCR